MIDRREIGGIAVGIALGIGGLAYLVHRASTPPEPMERGELVRVARQLASDARESQRLSRLAGTGQVNQHYARAQHKKIAEDVQDAREALDRPPPRASEDDTRRTLELAGRMEKLLDEAAPQLADRAAMQRLEDEHARIAAELERIAK